MNFLDFNGASTFDEYFDDRSSVSISELRELQALFLNDLMKIYFVINSLNRDVSNKFHIPSTFFFFIFFLKKFVIFYICFTLTVT